MSSIKTSVKTTYSIEYEDYYGDPVNFEFDDKQQYEETLRDLKILESGGYRAVYERLAKKLDDMPRPDYYPNDQVYEAISKEEADLLFKLPKILEKNIWVSRNGKDDWDIQTGCNDDLIKVIGLFGEMGWFNGLDPRYDVPKQESEDEPKEPENRPEDEATKDRETLQLQKETESSFTAQLRTYLDSMGYIKSKEVAETVYQFLLENYKNDSIFRFSDLKLPIAKIPLSVADIYLDDLLKHLLIFLVENGYIIIDTSFSFAFYKATEKINFRPEDDSNKQPKPPKAVKEDDKQRTKTVKPNVILTDNQVYFINSNDDKYHSEKLADIAKRYGQPLVDVIRMAHNNVQMYLDINTHLKQVEEEVEYWARIEE